MKKEKIKEYSLQEYVREKAEDAIKDYLVEFEGLMPRDAAIAIDAMYKKARELKSDYIF